MKSKSKWGQIISVGAIAGLITTVGILPAARGDLVYEPEVSPAAAPAVRADDRDQMRTALQSSEKAKSTVQAAQPAQPVVQAYQAPVQQAQPVVQYVAPVTAPMVQSVYTPVQQQPVQTAGVSTTDAPQTEVQSLSKTELMRRERTRTELQNEDLLQERLEELRLRDEKKRTDQLLGQEPGAQQGGEAQQVVAPAYGAPAVQAVAPPVTEHPGQPAVAPVPTAAQAAAPGPDGVYTGTSAYTPAAQAQMYGGQSVTTASQYQDPNADHIKLSVAPHAGVSIMNADNAFNVSGKYSAGLGIGLGVTDNLTVELGYTYSEYGIGLGNYQSVYTYTGSSDTYVLKQNVFDLGLKLSLLGPDSKFRPFVGFGAAYAKGYLNYPSQITQAYQQSGLSLPDFESNDFLGSLSVGFDAQVSKTVSVGVTAKYYKVLSDNENENLNYGAFYQGGYGGFNGAAAYDPGKAQAGTQLAQSSFYSLLADVQFSF